MRGGGVCFNSVDAKEERFRRREKKGEGCSKGRISKNYRNLRRGLWGKKFLYGKRGGELSSAANKKKSWTPGAPTKGDLIKISWVISPASAEGGGSTSGKILGELVVS